LVIAVTGAASVVNYGVGYRLNHVAGWAHRGSSAPLCSADNPRTCYWIKDSLPFLFIVYHVLYYDLFNITTLYYTSELKGTL
jgi:hypothetical protein